MVSFVENLYVMFFGEIVGKNGKSKTKSILFLLYGIFLNEVSLYNHPLDRINERGFDEGKVFVKLDLLLLNTLR